MKILITNYTFDASAKTITFGDYVSIDLEKVLLVTNVTDNIIIYNFSSSTKGGTVATNVLTLDYDTTSMSDTDDLQIYYDDTTITTDFATETTLQSIESSVSGIDINTGSIDSTTQSIDTNVQTLAAVDYATETTLASIKTAIEILDNIVSGNEAQVDVVTQPARDRLTDNIGAALQTDVIMNDTTALTPKFAAIDAATSGDNTIVAAVSGKKIRVLSAFLIAAGTVNARFESGASGTALTGQMNLVANTGFVLPFNPAGWFETASGSLLNLELSAAVSVDGSLTYIEV